MSNEIENNSSTVSRVFAWVKKRFPIIFVVFFWLIPALSSGFFATGLGEALGSDISSVGLFSFSFLIGSLPAAGLYLLYILLRFFGVFSK